MDCKRRFASNSGSHIVLIRNKLFFEYVIGGTASNDLSVVMLRGTANQLDDAHTFDALFFCLCIFFAFIGYMYGNYDGKPNLYTSKDDEDNQIFLLETE